MFVFDPFSPVPFVPLFLSEDDGKNPPVPPAKPERPQFDDAQQQHVNDLLAAERKNAEERTEQRLKDESAKRDAEAKADAARQAEIDKGNFEAVKTALETERDTAKAELDATKANLDAANIVIAAQVAVMKGDLPAELLGGYPETGAPLDQLAWLKDRQSVFDAAKAVAGAAGANVTRLPQTPKGGNQNTQEVTSLVSRHAI